MMFIGQITEIFDKPVSLLNSDPYLDGIGHQGHCCLCLETSRVNLDGSNSAGTCGDLYAETCKHAGTVEFCEYAGTLDILEHRQS